MKKSIIILIVFIMIIPLYSFEFNFLNLEEVIYLSPFAHYFSNEGLREKNSFELNFNNISVTDPITGEIFVIPSSLLSDKLEFNNKFTNKIYIFSNNKNQNGLGFVRDGFSLKSEKTVDITNSLYFSYGKKRFYSMFIISNYGNTYTHFKDSFIGPGLESYLDWEADNLILNFYMNLRKNNDSVYPMNELEQSAPIEFTDDAKANTFKNFLGGSLKYIKKNNDLSLEFLLSFSYGAFSQKGGEENPAIFDSENSIWDKNYPRNYKSGFFDFKNLITLSKNTGNINLKFSLKINYLSANAVFNLPSEGIIYDGSLKADNYGYDFSIGNFNILPSITFKVGEDTGFSAETTVGYNMLYYNIDKYNDNVKLNSLDYALKASYIIGYLKTSVRYSSFSKPLNLIKLMYLSNNFTPYYLYYFQNNGWVFETESTPIPYIFKKNKNFNRINRLKFDFKYSGNDNLILGFTVVSDKMKYFWDRGYVSENKDIFYIGAIEKTDNILFSPERKYTGFNFSIKKIYENDFLNAGITYMITKGNYNNDFNSVLSNYAYSNLFIDNSLQQKFVENYKLTYGNGLKFYFFSNLHFSDNINIKLYFVHMPPLNMINYKIGFSSLAIIPDTLENKTKSLNLLSLGTGYKIGKFNFFIGFKNIFNSTPVLFKNGVDNTPLIKFPGFSSFMGINYSL